MNLSITKITKILGTTPLPARILYNLSFYYSIIIDFYQYNDNTARSIGLFLYISTNILFYYSMNCYITTRTVMGLIVLFTLNSEVRTEMTRLFQEVFIEEGNLLSIPLLEMY